MKELACVYCKVTSFQKILNFKGYQKFSSNSGQIFKDEQAASNRVGLG